MQMAEPRDRVSARKQVTGWVGKGWDVLSP